MNEKAQSYVPPHVAMCWVDDRYIYVATPMGYEQYIQNFPLTEGGLSKALNLLKARYAQLPPGHVFTPVRQATPKVRIAKRWSGEPSKKRPELTDERSNAVDEILKKRGMLRR